VRWYFGSITGFVVVMCLEAFFYAVAFVITLTFVLVAGCAVLLYQAARWCWQYLRRRHENHVDREEKETHERV